jgi:hypothetical protein
LGKEARSLRSLDDPRQPEIEIGLEVAPPTGTATDRQGGDAPFEIDRDVAESLYASHPGGVDAFEAVGGAAHEFLERAVRFLTADAGLRQFLVGGSSISGRANVHEIAQEIAPEARAVYVLFDPVMLVYAHRLLRGTPEGSTAYVRARLRDVDVILRDAATTLDLSQPVAVLLQGNLSYVRTTSTATRIVDRLMAPLVAGSHLMITHHASDLLVDEVGPVYRRIAELAAEGRAWEVAPRSAAEVAAFFAGLELVEPGVVPVERWRPDGRGDEPVKVGIHGAVGRKRRR